MWLSCFAMWLVLGCSEDPDARTFSDEDDVENTEPIEAHDHAHAPHGGLYAVFGAEEYHGEIVFDEEVGDLTVYILGSDGKTPYPITEEQVAVHMDLLGGEHLQLSLQAAPEAGDPEGASSRFLLAKEHVPDEVHTADKVTIIATIDGEEYEGDVIREEHAHDHGVDDPEHAHSHDGSHSEGEHAHSTEGDAAQHVDEETSNP